MPQLEHIDAIERRLWSAADTLRANSKYASNQYFLPVMGLSLTPGRYVGVAPEEGDEDFDFSTAMREIHAELADLNAEAAVLAVRIQKNFEKLGICPAVVTPSDGKRRFRSSDPDFPGPPA
ncbi:MAG: hypothetical protein OXG72_06270 [Acidobacteria bacterium]|nr:hypothetical protein [Acidobacteriota bacterium]